MTKLIAAPSGLSRARCAGAVLLGALLGLAPSRDARAESRLLESDDRRVVLEILPGEPSLETVGAAERTYTRLRLDGHGTTNELGMPEVPVGSVLVAVPPGTRPRLRVLRSEWSAPRSGAVFPTPDRVAVSETFGTDRVDELAPVESPRARSAAYPAQPFFLSEVMGMRHLSVVYVGYHAAQTERGNRSWKSLTRAVVEVTFEEEVSRGRRGPSTRPAPREESWRRGYRNAVVNSADARAWARAGAGDAPSVGNAPWGSGTQWKVLVVDDGLTDLRFDDLAAKGFPAGIPIDQVALYQRDFDLADVDDGTVAAADLFLALPVPADVQDGGQIGVFDSGDVLRFWGRSFRDQWMTSGWEHEDKFGQDNYVWVRIDPAGGARMPLVRSGGSLSGAPGDSLASTPRRVRREEDRRYYSRPADFGPGVGAFESEIYYWNDARTLTDVPNGWGLQAPGDPFPVVGLVPGTTAEMTVRVVGGGRRIDNFHTNDLDFFLNDGLVGELTFYNDDLYVGTVVPPENVLHPYTVSPGVLTEGTNHFNLNGRTFDGRYSSPIPPGAIENAQTRFFLDWYEVTYQGDLDARDAALRLETAGGGPANVIARVTGFTAGDVFLYDVTDPAAPARVDVVASQVVPDGGGFALRFDHDNTGGPAAFLAVRNSTVPGVGGSRITRVDPPALLASGVGADYVVVTNDLFLSGARELADYRASRYSSIAVPVSTVYDTFGNGMVSSEAIKAYMTYAFHRWSDPVEFLVLVGDASEDHRGVGANSAPDFIPSHSLWAAYEGVFEETDQYYAELTKDGTGDFDDISDLYVGRFAVNTVEELDWNLQRLRAYEGAAPDARWRRTVGLSADDRFSGSLGGGFGEGYGWKSSEHLFETYSRRYADSLRAHPYDPLVVKEVYLSQWSHPCADSCYGRGTTENCARDCEADHGVDCGFWYDCRNELGCTNPNGWPNRYTCMRVAMRNGVNPAIRQMIDDGVLIWNFQGHANKFFLTHEEVFRDDPIGTARDVDALMNEGKPHIFLGFACHLAEFDRADEGDFEDCVAEKLMNSRPFGVKEPGGAIAAFASSGYEFLNPNLSFNFDVFDAFFYPEKLDFGGLPDVTSDDGTYEWVLGESTTRARIRFQQRFPFPGDNTRQASQRFILLGDPALSPSAGLPTIQVTVNGQTVGDGAFLDTRNRGEPLEIVAEVTYARGIGSTRIVDSKEGEVPVSAYQVTASDTSSLGVVQRKVLEYEMQVRPDDYDVVFEATAGGQTSTFTLRVSTEAEVAELTVYPNPFVDEATVYYQLTGAADEVRVTVYTQSGRKVWETRSAPAGADVNTIAWDGRDQSGQDVAKGTYFVRLESTGAQGSSDRTVPVVKMR